MENYPDKSKWPTVKKRSHFKGYKKLNSKPTTKRIKMFEDFTFDKYSIVNENILSDFWNIPSNANKTIFFVTTDGDIQHLSQKDPAKRTDQDFKDVGLDPKKWNDDEIYIVATQTLDDYNNSQYWEPVTSVMVKDKALKAAKDMAKKKKNGMYWNNTDLDESIVNEVRVEAVGAKISNVPKDLVELITVLREEIDQRAELTEKIKKATDKLQTLDKVMAAQKAQAIETLEKYKLVDAKVETTLGKVEVSIKDKSRTTKETKSYMSIAETISTELVPKSKAAQVRLVEIYNEFTKAPITTTWKELEMTDVKEGLKDTIRDFVAWFKGTIGKAFTQLKALLPSYEKSANKLFSEWEYWGN